MRGTVSVIGILLVLAGLVWIAPGRYSPFAPQSFRTADRAWLFVGAVTAAVGALMFGWARRQTGRAS